MLLLLPSIITYTGFAFLTLYVFLTYIFLTKNNKTNKQKKPPECEYFVLFLWIVFTVFHFQRTTHSTVIY